MEQYKLDRLLWLKKLSYFMNAQQLGDVYKFLCVSCKKNKFRSEIIETMCAVQDNFFSEVERYRNEAYGFSE